jgi:LacI family transcriptional regulator
MNQKRGNTVTLQNVAEHAGVSRATASLVVRGSHSISEATREKVFASMRELGYVYDRVAANLRSKSSSTVGLIIMELANSFYSELLVGIHQELSKFGQTVLLGTTFDSQTTQDRLMSTMLEHRVGGIILSAVPGSSSEAVEKVQSLGVPVVLVGRKIADGLCDYVGVDNVLGAELAVNHLLRHGHRRIGFIGGFARLSSWQGRKQGYDNALRQAGIPVDPSLVIESPATLQMGTELIQKVMAVANPPTAVFCYNDAIAIGAMMKLKEMGITPGKDVAIVGFDNIPEAAIFSPKLSTVSSDIRTMGFHAAHLLHARIEGLDTNPQNVIVEPRLIIRESCACTADPALHDRERKLSSAPPTETAPL